ncbi:MAG: hypothetical protein KAT00_05760 [Planctomycetes bacterium]|nr:hypothetical protein [Planctomycetota bacterium]
MSFEVTTAFVQEYKAVIELLLQQRGSRLRDTVMTDSFTGKAGKAVEQIGPVEAQTRVTRHGDTPLISTPHDARWVFPVDKEWADLIDDFDKLKMIIDPQSAYAQNGAFALGRGIDREIIRAFFDIAKTGENGTTNTSFDTANQQVAAGTSGMTVAKLREAKKILLANEVDIDNDPLFCGITAEQHDDLLSETQAISLDYNTKPVLVDGKITSFMGFNFKHTELYGVDGSSNRRCPAWAKSGMKLGIWNDINASIDKRPDKSNSMQVYLMDSVGATRLEEGKVVEILCAE